MRNRFIGLLVLTALAVGCAYDPSVPWDFNFPIERGDIASGQLAFTALGCHQCHSVAGTQLPAYPFPSPVHHELGGPSASVKSYAGLMTSVMNPSYHISDEFRQEMRVMGEIILDSPMPYFEYMSLGQLFDIVAFLDSKYQFVFDYE